MDFSSNFPLLLLRFAWLLAIFPLAVVSQRNIRVRYGYFPEARPFHAACARGWFDLDLGDVFYQVICYPQTSGNFASSRLDDDQLDIALLGSTPMAQAHARGLDVEVFYITQYQGESQGIYVRASDPEANYTAISNPFELVGRTVGVPFGSTMHYQVLFLLDLFGLEGQVELLDLAPTQIIEAWNEQSIDAAACWGNCREAVLQESGSDNSEMLPANVLMTAGVLADWGRPTFVNAAARRDFAEAHPTFMEHFAGVMASVNDAFSDRLGEKQSQNTIRWDGQQEAPASLVPSMVDALMAAGEDAGNPSQELINRQRRVLDLFIQQTAQEQLTCEYLSSQCGKPTQQHISLQQTAQFLLEQKLIAELGPLEFLADDDNGCDDVNTFCGSGLVNPEWLQKSQRNCVDCHLVGRYQGIGATSENLISTFEFMDSSTNRSPFPENEIGRANAGEASGGDSNCQGHRNLAPTSGSFGDGANGLAGRSYSDNMECSWAIRSSCGNADPDCDVEVFEVSFPTVRIWSGDFLRIYTDPSGQCTRDSPNKVLLAQISGFYQLNELPPFQAEGCLLIEFDTDGNQERSYGDPDNQGDGFSANYRRVQGDCNSNPSNCVFGECNYDGSCQCSGLGWGADCSFTKHCLGRNVIDLDAERVIASAGFIDETNFFEDSSILYANDLDCSFDFQVGPGYMEVEVFYDLETSHDFLWLQTGADTSPFGNVDPYIVLTGSSNRGDQRTNGPEVYYVPTDASGMASVRLVTDARGRRAGFHARVRPASRFSRADCEPGYGGSACEIPFCTTRSELSDTLRYTKRWDSDYTLGSGQSQPDGFSVRPMPFAPEGGCIWPLVVQGKKVPREIVGIRIVFNSKLDLEPYPSSAVGDKLVIRTDDGDTEFFVEECISDETCTDDWQTGECGDNGGCIVRDSVEVKVADVTSAYAHLITDRNDGGNSFAGLNFDAVLVRKCPLKDDTKHCEALEGAKCEKDGCLCDGKVPCACTCVGDAPGTVGEIRTGLVVGIVLPIFVVLFIIFYWYRRRKILKSRAQKHIIEAKEAELEAFRNSVVGMRTAIQEYIPKVVNGKERAIPKPRKVNVPPARKVTWCWQETPQFLDRHDNADIFDPADCFIKYDEDANRRLEAAFQEQGRSGTYNVIPGYVVDFDRLLQIKSATGYQREVKRVEEVPAADQISEIKEIDTENALLADDLPSELVGEPQMVLVTGDVVQISSQRQDGWAFGTKLLHADEAVARELVRRATEKSDDDEPNVFTDTGWFMLDATEVPSGEDLAALQTSVGDTGALAAPDYWAEVDDPSIVQLQTIRAGDSERDDVIAAFMSTLKPPKFDKKVKVTEVQRIQNLAMWQSYVVKRQTICYREIGAASKQEGADADALQKKALARFERRWLWHGTNAEVMNKIMQQGFNRSFCGKNATMYGKGVYFARDASYSAYPTYSVPDSYGYQYVMACRVVVGEYCKGRMDGLTPDIRDAASQALYDTTVGMLSGDTMSNPSIYVTYHDAQAYPEYLIKFRCK